MTQPQPARAAADRRALLAALFAEALARDRVGEDEDFFELGGQSVQAMVLAARIRAELGVDLSVAALFDAPTVAELDRLLGRGQPRTHEDAPPRPVGDGEGAAGSAAIHRYHSPYIGVQMEQITPFRIAVPQADLDDLNHRLDHARFSTHCFEGEGGWSRGVPTAYLRELADYWRHRYDWRAAEAHLNSFPQYTTEIDGATIHFLHVRSPEPDAVPMIISHGFPDSFVQFLDVIGPLTDPRAHGGDPSQAFHLVIPSLPGFGYSQPTGGRPWPFPRVAEAWAELMARLGYDRYVTQGADLGMWISLLQAGRDAEHVIGAHVNFLITPPASEADMADLSPEEGAIMSKLLYFDTHLSGFTKIQTTRPQTLGAGLVDSPVGQLAWIVEKFFDWTDSAKAPEDAVDRDRMLTNVMLYWLTRSGMTAAHFYYDNVDHLPVRPPIAQPPVVTCPLAVAAFPADPGQAVRRFAERLYPDIAQWTEYERGGHFPSMEVPELMIEDIRKFATALRGRC